MQIPCPIAYKYIQQMLKFFVKAVADETSSRKRERRWMAVLRLINGTQQTHPFITESANYERNTATRMAY